MGAGARRPGRVWKNFCRALGSEVDDAPGGATVEGVHLGAMAGTLDLLQRCYTGLEVRGDGLRFAPELPDELR
jgi:trehalose/maltose hydrolase-like predicted phosphorylase